MVRRRYYRRTAFEPFLLDDAVREMGHARSIDHARDFQLDRIFAVAGDQPSIGHVAFNVGGYLVTVYSNGQIVITPPPHRE